jgi:hypothetical protein
MFLIQNSLGIGKIPRAKRLQSRSKFSILCLKVVLQIPHPLTNLVPLRF